MPPTVPDESVVIEYGSCDTSASSNIANASSAEKEVKQNDTGEVEGDNLLPKYSSDYDIGLYIKPEQHISDDVKYNLLMNHFKPTELYDFKADASGKRCFRLAWLSQYSPWLAYSSKLKGALCVYCTLFPQNVVFAPLQKFLRAPMNVFHRCGA